MLPFKPHPLLKNCHLQTLWTRLARYRANSRVYWHSLSLPDGDFVDLAWSAPMPECLHDSDTPLLIIFHGLEGSVRSAYADHLMNYANSNGWHAVTMHFRGCSGRLNRAHRAYHSGDTADARYFIETLQQLTSKPLYAAGFSLGGNMLVKLLGEAPALPLRQAVCVSAPLALGPSSYRIDQGFSRIYRTHLLDNLKRKVLLKLQRGELANHIRLDASAIRRIVNFRTFDDQITAPLHGFRDVDDYYSTCSGLHFLSRVRHPLLIIHAADDPFTCAESIPQPDSYPANIKHELSEHGGHVGFISSRRGRPHFWLSQRIFSYFTTPSTHKAEQTNHEDSLSAA